MDMMQLELQKIFGGLELDFNFFPWAQWSLVVDMMQLELQKNIWLELVDVTSKFFRWAQCAQWSLVMDMMQLELKKKIIWW